MNANTRLIDLTVADLQGIIAAEVQRQIGEVQPQRNPNTNEKWLVFGIDGIAQIFICSRSNALRIKQSGIIDKAICQIGRKITVDARLALELANKHKYKKS